jgi:hypothetical protein
MRPALITRSAGWWQDRKRDGVYVRFGVEGVEGEGSDIVSDVSPKGEVRFFWTNKVLLVATTPAALDDDAAEEASRASCLGRLKASIRSLSEPPRVRK